MKPAISAIFCYDFSEKFPRGRGKFHPLDFKPSAELPDDEYPLTLSTGYVLEHWHGGTLSRHSWMNDLYPEALMELHPDDANRLGIQDGDAVRDSSRRGSIVLRVKVTLKTTPGVVFIPFFSQQAAANVLTNNALDPLAKIPEFKACAVKVTPLKSAELPPEAERQPRGRY